MPQLEVHVQVNGNPLRRAYVEHLVFGVVQKLYITDNDGRVRDEHGTPGIASVTPNADIRVLCQNSVARVLDGDRANIMVTQDKGIVDGTTFNINTDREQDDYYILLNRALLAYDIAIRQFRPFSDLSDPDFPLGRAGTLNATKDGPRIEFSFPSRFPLGTLAFTEPSSASTHLPLIHIRERRGPLGDGRLFGEDLNNGKGLKRPTLIPSELAHALHFSRFTKAQREGIERDYIGWISTDIANGGAGTHDMGVRTSPKVAFIEALDHFSSRFTEFVRVALQGDRSRLLKPVTITPAMRDQFLQDELSGAPSAGRPVIAGARAALATLDGGGNIVPNATVVGRADDEGAVYGCIFLDFARRVGLLSAVNAYFQSAADGALTFGDYKTWIRNNRPARLPDLTAAQATWGL